MTNSISIDNFSKLNQQLEELKIILDSPKIFLRKYFLELRNDINNSFIQQHEYIDETQKSSLLENWLRIITKLNEFENNCYSHLVNELDHKVFDTSKLKLSQLNKRNSMNSIEMLCQEIHDLIQSEKFKVERTVFCNKTIFFMSKFKLNDNLPLVDHFNKKSEILRLFEKMNPDVTAGKLIIINDEYFNKEDLNLLKNKLNLQYKSTFDLLKRNELKRNLRLNLNEEQIVELELKLDKLIEFDLNGKNLIKIDADIFNRFPKVQQIKLANNQLKQLNSDIFSGLKDLNLIWLQNNLLKVLDSKIFHDLTKLTHLDLSRNQLIEINSILFQDLNELVHLNLSFNNLKVISSEAFKCMKKLKFIDLSNNSLLRLSSRVFNGLSKLESIYLNHNQFQSIDSNLFNGLINLKMVNLSDCELYSLDKSLFKNLFRLELIHLENNLIVSIDPLLFQNGLDSLREIHIKGNPGLKKIDKDLFYNFPINKWSLFK